MIETAALFKVERKKVLEPRADEAIEIKQRQIDLLHSILNTYENTLYWRMRLRRNPLRMHGRARGDVLLSLPGLPARQWRRR
jgi:hypothetical protein